jgi:ribonuclease Z
MPLNVHEIRDDCLPREDTKQEDKWAPLWADDNIKVWAMSISPSASKPFPTNGKKRSFDEVNASEKDQTTLLDADLTPQDRDYLTVKAVVSEMFNSSWRLDTLHETRLSEVKLPATMFIRNKNTNKVEKYSGPLPGDNPPPETDTIVLVRKPWPGALVESLPPTQPAKEAISYIIRNHTQRGKFNPQRAIELKVPKGISWAALTKGESVVNDDGETITPDMVLGASRVGGGIAVIDIPTVDYIDSLISRSEWREPKVMEGVGAVFWICGKNVAMDPRLHAFMQEMANLEHVVSSPDYCPNNIALDSVAASTIRLREVDPDRYGVPVHDAADGASTFGGNNDFISVREKHPLPEKVHIAARGQVVVVEPAIDFQTKDAIPDLQIADAVAEMPQDVMEEALKAQESVKAPSEELKAWVNSLPPGAQDAEVITLGTGSALPSKYRNVSATLVRVPGWGNILLDCGENTLGQLRRVYTASELKQVLRDLKILVISHMHADHQLGTTAVVKAWYAEVHNSQPAPPQSPSNEKPDWQSVFENQNRLSIISEPAMQNWLAEYSSVEDYGYSRLAPLSLSPVNAQKGWKSRLSWFIPPTQLKYLPQREYQDRLNAYVVPDSLLGLEDIQAVAVKHCHGARAVSITLPTGFKVSYSGDCRPSKAFSQIGKGSTVCIHEATFDDELQGDAEAKNHSTTSEALGVAQNMGAKACVLTHFSQRYQKVPVLERADDDPKDVPMVDVVADLPQDDGVEEGGPLEDVTAATFPNQPEAEGSVGKQYDLPPEKAATAPEAVKFKLNSDMKVCVAFDYMKVKVGDIGVMEKFTPALLKLFAEEEKEKEDPVPASGGKTQKKGKEKKNGGKGGR